MHVCTIRVHCIFDCGISGVELSTAQIPSTLPILSRTWPRKEQFRSTFGAVTRYVRFTVIPTTFGAVTGTMLYVITPYIWCCELKKTDLWRTSSKPNVHEKDIAPTSTSYWLVSTNCCIAQTPSVKTK